MTSIKRKRLKRIITWLALVCFLVGGVKATQVVTSCKGGPFDSPQPIANPTSQIVVRALYPREIHIMNPDGSGLRRLNIPAQMTGSSPSVSPDGRRIAFRGSVKSQTPNSATYIMNLDGSNLIKLSAGEGEAVGDLAWSPNGQHIAFVGDYYDPAPRSFLFYFLPLRGKKIYIMNSNGTDVRLLVNEEGEETAGVGSPTWSPDGKQIAYHSWRHAALDNYTNTEIYVMNADGSNQRRLTYNWHRDLSPAWSPDGKRIAFVSRTYCKGLHLMNPDGSGRTQLTYETGQSDLLDPAWSPDGKQIAFTLNPISNRDNGPYNVHVVNADGSGRVQITQEERGYAETNWRRKP